MKIKNNHLSFISGILIGGLLFGGSAAYAAGILAAPIEDTDQTIVLNGAEIELTGYAINGNNYFKLRDVAAAVDFGVTWDEASRAVSIDTSVGYSPAETKPAPLPSIQPEYGGTLTDYSQVANPALFTGAVTREAYNVMRQAIVGKEAASAVVTNGTFEIMHEVSGAIGIYPSYELNHYSSGYEGSISCAAKYVSANDAAVKHTESFIKGLSVLDDAEKIRQIDFYVSDRLTYALTYPSPSTVLASDEVKRGACMAYAYSFQWLCQQAGIPCILVHSETHQWNQVYVNGQWWNVDVTSDDSGDEVDIRDQLTILWKDADMQGSIFINSEPQNTMFAKELLVPGSTK